MKCILFIMPAMLGGGAEKVLIDILSNWDSSKSSVSVLLERNNGIYVDDIPNDVDVIHVPKWIRAVKRISKYVRSVEHIYSSLVKKLVIRHEYETIVSFMEGEAVKLHSLVTEMGTKNVSWVHIDMNSKHWTTPFFKDIDEERKCYSIMNEIIFVSEQAKEGFKLLFGLPDTKQSVIYNLIDASKIQKESSLKAIPHDGFTICMAGRLNQQKRYDRALDAIARLKEDQFKVNLWIVGTGELLGDLHEQTKRLGIEELVTFWGFQKPPYAHMASADIFLNTSESEGYPLTICEALCLGKPIIATDVSGAREILGDNEFGIVVTEDVKAIVDAIESLATDSALIDHYKAKAKEKATCLNTGAVMSQIYSVLMK